MAFADPERDPYDDLPEDPFSARWERRTDARDGDEEVVADSEESDTGWPAPRPLLQFADPLPTNALGDVIGPMVEATAHALQVPSDLVVNMALPLVTTAAVGRWRVEIKEGWRENFALATLTISGSSTGKTPVQGELVAPLIEYEQEIAEGSREQYARSKAVKQELHDRMESYRTDLKNTKSHNLIEGSEQYRQYQDKQKLYYDAAAAHDAHEVAKPPRWTADDVTPEALAQLMSEQSGAIGVISDEAGFFNKMGGQYSQGRSNLDVVLKGYSGSRIQVDRKGVDAPPLVVNNPVLSICLGIQPGLMRKLGDKGEFRDSGLLGRFLPVMPDSILGYRDLDPEPIPDEVRAAWRQALRSVARVGQKLRADGERRLLVLEPAAEACHRHFRGEIEPEFREGGRLAALHDWGGKLAGVTARIAGVLALMADADTQTVSADDMTRAIALARGYVAHAHVAFGTLGGGDPTTPHARVVAWLVKHGKDVVSHREVGQAFKKKPWGKSAELRNLMDDLESANYVRADQRSAEGMKGGRPSTVWLVNPAVLTTHLRAPGEVA